VAPGLLKVAGRRPAAANRAISAMCRPRATAPFLRAAASCPGPSVPEATSCLDLGEGDGPEDLAPGLVGPTATGARSPGRTQWRDLWRWPGSSGGHRPGSTLQRGHGSPPAVDRVGTHIRRPTGLAGVLGAAGGYRVIVV